MEAHRRSILETVAVDVRTVVEIRILQVEEKEEGDTTVVSLGEVGTQASDGHGSEVVVAVVVAAALGVDMGYVEAEVAGESTWFVAVGDTCSAGVGVGWKSRTVSWSSCPTFLTLRRGHEWASVEGVGVVGCRFVVGVELAEMVLPRIGSVSAQGLANRTGSEKAEAAEVETWWGAGECS